MLVENTYSNHVACVLDCASRLALFRSAFAPLPSAHLLQKGRNCETNPISFKTCCPPNTNNENISLLTKSKSYDSKRRARKSLPCLDWTCEKTSRNHTESASLPSVLSTVAFLPVIFSEGGRPGEGELSQIKAS
jgi:hypothetical protein